MAAGLANHRRSQSWRPSFRTRSVPACLITARGGRFAARCWITRRRALTSAWCAACLCLIARH